MGAGELEGGMGAGELTVHRAFGSSLVLGMCPDVSLVLGMSMCL